MQSEEGISVTSEIVPGSGLNLPDVGMLFQLFRDGQIRTNQEIQRLTGLGRTAVAVRTDALVEAGFLAPVGEVPSRGGRRAVQFGLDHRSRVVAGIDVGAEHTRVVLGTLAGAELATRHRVLESIGKPEQVLGWVIDTIRSCLDELEMAETALLGLGIGLPARVNFALGQPIKPVLMPGWDGYDVPRFFRERLTENVIVDNDVNVLAVNERATFWPDVGDLVFIKVGTGLGGAVIAGGAVQRGASGTAGDIGHVRVGQSGGVTGAVPAQALGDLSSGAGIVKELSAEGFTLSTVNDVLDLIRVGEPKVLEHLRAAGHALGEALASVVDMLNPSVIVLGGRLGTEGEYLLAGVRDIVYRLSLPAATQDLQIVRSRAGMTGAALGAARLILDDLLTPARVAATVAKGTVRPDTPRSILVPPTRTGSRSRR
jgi:glucokinase